MQDKLKVVGTHSKDERSKLDYYATDPRSTRALLKVEKFSKDIWEPSSGHNMITNVLKDAGYNVYSTDIFDYGYQDDIIDFLSTDKKWHGDIIGNPPYVLAAEFIKKGLELIEPGHKVVMFLRTLFLEGQKRYDTLFKDNPPKVIYVFTNRQTCDRDDDFSKGSAVSFSWWVWEKGWKGDPIIKWITSEK